MPRSRRLRRRPSTPNLQHAGSFHTADPASPPETPTRFSPFSRKSSLKPRHQPPFAALADDPHIRPVGDGHQFSYRPSIGPAQLSPRDSSSDSSQAIDSSDEEVDDEDDEEDEDEQDSLGQNMPMELNRSRYEIFLRKQSQSDSEKEESDEDEEDDASQRDDGDPNVIDSTKRTASAKTSAVVWDIQVVEDMDPMDPGSPALEVLHPYEIEASRAGTPSIQRDRPDISRPPPSRLNRTTAVASPSSSDEDSEEDSDDLDSDNDDACTADLDPERAAFERHQEHMRRLRRVSMSSSVGKRTHSELSDDSDDEFLDVNDVGSSARRFRKRLHRSSLLFHDPPQKIVELEEPNSSEDEWVIRAKAGRKLAQELPYFWEMEVSEVESSYDFTFTVDKTTKR